MQRGSPEPRPLVGLSSQFGRCRARSFDVFEKPAPTDQAARFMIATIAHFDSAAP